jgi:hypothetical protein
MSTYFSRWQVVVAGLVLGVGLGVLTLTCTSQPPSEPAQKDSAKGKQDPKKAGEYKEITFLELGVVLLAPEQDKKSDFVIAGKNATSLVRGLKRINGRTVAALEKDMRPADGSPAGFLGKDEKLLLVLAGDNEYVADAQGMSHQELARNLFAMEAIWHKLGGPANPKEPVRCLYYGRRYEVRVDLTRGERKSPFDDGTSSKAHVHVTNVENGQKLEYSGLVPHLVERYGFYAGKDSPLRVEPKQVIEVFDFLKPAAK